MPVLKYPSGITSSYCLYLIAQGQVIYAGSKQNGVKVSIIFFIIKTQRDVTYMSNVSNRILAAPSPSLHIVRLLRGKALYPCPPENRTNRSASAFFRFWSSYPALWSSTSISAVSEIPLGSSSLSAVHHISGDGDCDGGLALILFDNAQNQLIPIQILLCPFSDFLSGKRRIIAWQSVIHLSPF